MFFKTLLYTTLHKNIEKSLEKFPSFRDHKATSESIKASTAAATATATATAAAATAVAATAAAVAAAAAACAVSALAKFETSKDVTIGKPNSFKKKIKQDGHLFVHPSF